MSALAEMLGCTRCGCPLEQGDLRCAACALAVPADPAAIAATSANVVRCDGCGACVAYDVKAREPRCAFCGAVTHVESIEDPLEQAQAALPFVVGPAEAREALRGWLGSQGFFRPSDLASASTVDALQPLWWPAWVSDVRAEVSWTADSNVGAHRADWAPHAGEAQLEFRDVLVSASRGLTEEEVQALRPRFQLASEATAASPPEGAVTEQFDLQRSSARARVVEAIESLAAQQVLADHVPGTRKRNLHTSLVLRDLRTRRLSIPTYVLAYRYGGRVYRALVHGQDAGLVIGSAPLSWPKVLAVSAAGLIVAVALLSMLLR